MLFKITIMRFCFIIITLLCWGNCLQGQTKNVIDSLSIELKKWHNRKNYEADTTLYNIYYKLGLEYQSSNIDTAIHFMYLSISKADQHKLFFEKALSLNQLGWYNYLKGNYNAAIEFYDKALKSVAEIKNKVDKNKKLNLVASIESNQAIIYKSQGNYAKAIEFYLKCLKTNEEIGNKRGQVINLNNIAILYDDQQEYTKALEYYFKALEISKGLETKKLQALILGNIGAVYFAKEKFTEALDFYTQSLKINEELGNKQGMASNLGNIGMVYVEQKQYDLALEYYLNALSLDELTGNKKGLAKRLQNIGLLYSAKKDYKNAEEYLKKSLEKSIELNNLYLLNEVYNSLYEIYLSTNQYQEALNAYKQYIIYKDSLFSEENQKALVQKEMQYKLEKQEVLAKEEIKRKELIIERNRQDMFLLQKENEIHTFELKNKKIETENQQKTIALLNKERLIKEVEAKQKEEQVQKQKIIIYFTLIGVFLVTTLLVVAIRAYLQKQKANKIITEQKLIVEQQKIEVEKQKQILQEQKELIEEKNMDIINSIIYAQRIQNTILADMTKWKLWFPNSFILYFPRDIVAGDFYWLQETEDYIFVAVADCTGHGVPGAMMSISCSNALNKVVSEEKTFLTHEILNKTRKIIIEQLHSEDLGQLSDGMDICLVRFDKQNLHHIQYSGANRSLYIVKSKQLIEYKADKQPIGFYYNMKSFNSFDIHLEPSSCLYLFTDGYQDQFGYHKKVKLGIKKFKEILVDISDKPIEEQKQFLSDFFIEWQGENHQMDDITVVGIQL